MGPAVRWCSGDDTAGPVGFSGVRAQGVLGQEVLVAFDGDDLFYGFVDGFVGELGYFRLSELMENRGKFGMEIERDLWFSPCPLSSLK